MPYPADSWPPDRTARPAAPDHPSRRPDHYRNFTIGFTFRVLALYLGWEEPLAKEPTGVYKHSDGRPLLGRKLAGKSQRELKDLGLLVQNPPAGANGSQS